MAKYILEVFIANGVGVLAWLESSPDFNPIKNT